MNLDDARISIRRTMFYFEKKLFQLARLIFYFGGMTDEKKEEFTKSAENILKDIEHSISFVVVDEKRRSYKFEVGIKPEGAVDFIVINLSLDYKYKFDEVCIS